MKRIQIALSLCMIFCFVHCHQDDGNQNNGMNNETPDPIRNSQPMEKVLLSSSKQFLFVLTKDNQARIRKRNGELVRSLDGHRDSIVDGVFSPDETKFVTVSLDRTARVWDLGQSDKLPIILKGHTQGLTSAAFYPDGQRVVTSSLDGTIGVWDVQTGIPVFTALTGHKGPVWTVAVDSSGQWLASGGDDKTVRIWSASSGELIDVLEGEHEAAIQFTFFAPQHSWLVSMDKLGKVALWSLQQNHFAAVHPYGVEGNAILTQKLSARPVLLVAKEQSTSDKENKLVLLGIVEGGKQVIAATYWLKEDGQLTDWYSVSVVSNQPTPIRDFAFYPRSGSGENSSVVIDNLQWITVDTENTARFWSAQNSFTNSRIRSNHYVISENPIVNDEALITTWKTQATSMVAFLDGQQILVASPTQGGQLWKLPEVTVTPNQTLKTPMGSEVSFSSDGSRFALLSRFFGGSSNPGVYVMNRSDGQQISFLAAPTNSSYLAQGKPIFSPINPRLLAIPEVDVLNGIDSRKIWLWSSKDGINATKADVEIQNDSILQSIQFCPQGGCLVAQMPSKTVLWQLDGLKITTLTDIPAKGAYCQKPRIVFTDHTYNTMGFGQFTWVSMAQIGSFDPWSQLIQNQLAFNGTNWSYHAEAQQQIAKLSLLVNDLCELQVSTDQNHFLTRGANRNDIWLTDRFGGNKVLTHPEVVQKMVLSSDGHWLAVALPTTIYIWDVNQGTLHAILRMTSNDLEFVPTQGLLGVLKDYQTLEFYDVSKLPSVNEQKAMLQQSFLL